MIVKNLQEYMTDSLIDRIQTLQTALNQAENIMKTLEEENEKLKDVLVSLTFNNDGGYALDGEALNEPVCSVG